MFFNRNVLLYKFSSFLIVENRETIENLQKQCHKLFSEYSQEVPLDAVLSKKCDSSNSVPVSFVHVLNSSKNFDKKAASFLMNFCGSDSNSENFEECSCTGYKAGTEGTCSAPKRTTNTKKTFPEESEDSLKIETSMYNSEFDHRAPEKLKVNHLRRQCELLHLSEAVSENIYLEEGSLEVSFEDFQHNNITLSYLLLF